jgi:hypothetical protein
MSKMNCWEFKKCGREPGGAKAAELGICTATTENRTDGINTGKNGGRSCWAITGTLCGGVIQGSFASKLGNCMKCEFYQIVGNEEGPNHQSSRDILAVLK